MQPAQRLALLAAPPQLDTAVGRQPSEPGSTPKPSATPAPSPCLETDDILAFCAGALAPTTARAAQHHLDLCPTCMDLVTLAISDWAPPEPVDPIELGSNLRGGDTIAGHRILRFLARGGMGEVYEALHAQTGERVALKLVLASASDNPHLLRRFRREASLARRIRHPNVCHVHAPTTASAALPYFTMDFIEGETLQRRLQRGPLPIPEALAIARQLLHGLGAIHSAGVLHLDLKANNIMLRRDPPSTPVILDFGLARRARTRATDRSMRPLTGSLPYMPPEQIRGEPPTPRNDIFAFGVVLFQMLTGELPFPSAQPSAPSSIVRRLAAHAPAPSTLRAGVPAWLDEVVLGCLAEVGERFEGVGTLIHFDP